MLSIAAIATVALSYVFYITIYIFTFRLCIGFKFHGIIKLPLKN